MAETRDEEQMVSTQSESTTTGVGRSTMRAITQDRYGGPDVLALNEVPVPVPGEGQVLVRVVNASLNIYDWHMTSGKPYMARAVAGLSAPKNQIPGADVAGVVEAVGPGTSRFAVGDQVFGEIGAGAFAQYAVADADRISRKPSNVSFVAAAATPMAGLTALQALRDRGGLEAGQRVLVNGASGGVGTFAVQIAKVLGAEVTAVCSTGKVAQAEAIGADRVVDYTKTDFTDGERLHDLLFDNVGDRPWRETSRVLSPGGSHVMITGPKHAVFGPLRHLLVRKAASIFTDKSFTWFTAASDPADLEFLGELVANGQLSPVIERTFPLADLPDALRYLGEGHARGKLVIEI
jgi:NADPH:quinone reductase-like Zn-dependent oxidoreductase